MPSRVLKGSSAGRIPPTPVLNSAWVRLRRVSDSRQPGVAEQGHLSRRPPWIEHLAPVPEPLEHSAGDVRAPDTRSGARRAAPHFFTRVESLRGLAALSVAVFHSIHLLPVDGIAQFHLL